MLKFFLRKQLVVFALAGLFSGQAAAQAVPELLYYKFDSPGTTVQNLASNPVGTSPAPITGGTIGGTGQFGTALIGAGTASSSNSVNTGWATNLGNNSWTISLWLNNIPSATGTVYFFGDNTANGFRAFTGGVAGAAGIRLTATGLTPVDMANVVSSGPVVIHYVYDAAAGNIKGYVNGVLNVTVAQSNLNLTGAGPFKVGGYSTTNSGLPAGGLLDEFRLYNRALTAAEITSTWNQTLPFALSPIDAGLTAIVAPVSPVQPGVSTPVTVTIRNFGTNAFTSGNLGFSVNGTVIANNIAFAGSIAPQATGTFTFSGHNFTAGPNNICAWIKVPGDGNPANDSTCTSVIACNAVSGTYTIDKNAQPSATTFPSFAAAIQALNSCGISGPVTFNVATGSGPYNEQVTLEAIPGTSATNTITFNGNGNKIAFANTASERAVIRLDGADHVTFNNFLIEATDATYGWGIHLLNGADNNTISNNTITLASTSTAEANSVGVVLSNSTTAVTSVGNTGSNNIITGNTITGGYKAIHINQAITTSSNNHILNNTILDFYADGIKVNAAKGTRVEGNNISRPARTTTTTFTGIEISGNSQETLVRGNRIHNSHAATTSKTGTAYGIFITASDAPVGSENLVVNNLIYNINNTGTVYALYNSGSDGAHYYHNTISLNNPASTGIVRGVYQTTAASNIRIINNIFAIAAGASGVKTGLYFNTATSSITSNNNVLFVNGNVGYSGSLQATLANWQAVNNGAYDQNSVAADPQFANLATGDLTPTNPAINNMGQPTPVTTDITGLARNPTSPDPGAYEFMNNPNDVGITAITSPSSACGLTGQEVVTVVITNFGTMPQSNIPVSFTLNGGTPVTAIFAGPLAAGASVTYSFATTVNLSGSGSYTLVAQTGLSGDNVASNDATTKQIANILIASLPATLDFETPATGVAALKTETRSRSTIIEDAGGARTGAKGMIMAGVGGAGWVVPVGQVDPWTNNPQHFSGAYACFSPAGGAATDSLWLVFDLKQLYKAAAANTNFRITVNGNQEGPTYNPPFTGTPIIWRTIKVDLTAYKNLANIEIGFESSVMEEFAGGSGTANLIDNIRIVRRVALGQRSEILAAQLKVFPNPSAGMFRVSLPQGETYQLTVTDLTGKVLKTQQATGNSQLELNGAAKGVYLLQVTGKQGVATRKLVLE